MKNRPVKLASIFFLFLVFSSFSNFANDSNKEIPAQNRNCGIMSLTRVGQLLIDPSFDALSRVNNPAIYSMFDLLNAADFLSLEPIALEMTPDELLTLEGPAILHLERKHFVTLLQIKTSKVLIYDNKEGEKWISIEEIENEWTGNLICFEKTQKGRNLSVMELKSLFGYDSSYHSSYPPGHPVYPDDRNDCDDNSAGGRNCRNGRGAPGISVSPIDLNLKVDDIPLWYKAGNGSDISIEIKYKNEASQPDQGIGSPNTMFYPMGVNCFFNYSSFYVQKANNNIMVIMPGGMQLLYTYNAGIYTPPPKYYNTLETSGSGFVLTMKNTKTKYFYTDPNHSKLTAIEDNNGNTLSFFYDANYNLDYMLDANGRTLQFTTDANGRITQVQDPMGRTAMFEYDTGGYLTKITDMGGYESFLTYGVVPSWTGTIAGTKKKLIAVQTPTRYHSIQYEIPATVGSTLPLYKITITNAEGNSKIYSWTPTFSNTAPTKAITCISDYNGNVTRYTIDMINDRIDKIVFPDIYSSIFYDYDPNGYRNKVDQDGYVSTYVYDIRGNLLQETNPRNKTTFLTYDPTDNLISITDPMNRMTNFTYDANNNITIITTAVNTQSFSYDVNGNLQTYIDQNGNTIGFNYDSFGYLSSINYPSGSPQVFSNDLVGRSSSISFNGNVYQYEYDNLDQITKITLADGKTISYTFDFTNVVEFIDWDGKTSSYTYDCTASCQLAHSFTPQGDISYTFDANGNVLQLSFNGQNTSFEYDNLNRNTKVINPDGTSRQYSYDILDNITTIIGENNTKITYYYDYDLLTNINYPGSTPDVFCEYNDNGELTGMIDGIGSTTLEYDNGGRLTHVSGPVAGDDKTYTYDGAGNISSMSMPGFNISNTYDDLNRLVQVASNYASVDYTYGPSGNLTRKTYGNGAFTDLSYDPQNRLKSLSNKKLNGDLISGFDYTLNSGLMVEKIIDNIGNIASYQYDMNYQLANEEVINQDGKTLWNNKFTYDNLGNRTTLDKNGILDHYTYNINNQLTSLTKTAINVSGIVQGDSATAVYVENIKANTQSIGNNLISFTANDIPLDQSNDSVLIYARVNEVLATVGDSAKFECTVKTMPDGSVNMYLFTDIVNVAPQNINTIYIKKDIIHYSYDANGNLVQREKSGEITNYTYDANNQLIRVDLPSGDYEEYIYNGFGQRIKTLINGIVDKTFIYNHILEEVAIKDSLGNMTYLTRGLDLGGGIGGLVGIHGNGTTSYNLYNGRGDIIGIINTTDSLLYNATYDAFGTVKENSGNQISDFAYSTKEFSVNTGLSYFGSRDYMEENGRWLTRDPLQFDAGFNFYAYANNNPVNFIDPDGEFILAAIAIGAGIYVVARGAIAVYEGFQSAPHYSEARRLSTEAMIRRPGRGTYRQRGCTLKQGLKNAAKLANTPGTTATGPPATSGGDLVAGAVNEGAKALLNRNGCKKNNKRRKRKRRRW